MDRIVSIFTLGRNIQNTADFFGQNFKKFLKFLF